MAQLAPAHAPPPVSWWPLAPGWWALLALLIAAAVGICMWHRSQPRRLRRSGLRELAKLEATTVGDAALARALENLVRRYAVVRYGRETVARLSGSRWLAFAVAHGATQWEGDTGAALLQAAYGGTPLKTERARWVAGARAFLKARK
jgi:membrane protein implicated in regulation of membrane protease activity